MRILFCAEFFAFSGVKI